MRISQGGTCLANVTPLYGCYGEFFRPLWTILIPSVKAITTVCVFLYLVAIFAATRFASRIIDEPEIVLFCGICLVALSSFYAFFDPYFQYWPVRTIFPCLALWLATAWQARPNGYKAFTLGIFSALAISWNLDSGVPVFLSLAALIVLSGCMEARSLQEMLNRERFLRLGAYCVGVMATLTMLVGYLSLKSGASIDLGLYTIYQRLEYISGYVMLPMPPLPNLWGAVVLVMLLAASAFAARILRGHADKRYELIGFAAILALGVFVYYTGRSHIRVLVGVSWLPLILAFFLADQMIAGSVNKAAKSALSFIGVGGTITLVAAWVWYYGKGIDDRWADQLHMSDYASPLIEDANFIARETDPNEKVAVFAPNQSSLVLTARRTLNLSGAGMVETFVWPQAKQTMGNLIGHGPEHLFLDPRVRSSDPYQPVFSAFEVGIRNAYVTRDWEQNGRLLHMVRRRTAMDRDAVPYDRPLQVSGGRSDFPLSVAKALTGPAFRLEMTIIAGPQQGRLAILASSTEVDSEPFQGLVIYHQAEMGHDHWVLAIGDGTVWKVTPPFFIPSGRSVTVEISYAAPELEIDVDGNITFRSANFAVLSPTLDPLYIGDWIPHMFRTNTPTDSPVDTKYESPNYWKIQDRRFIGEIVSAQLLP